HVLLGVSAIHTQRMQLHQFARVVLVQAAGLRGAHALPLGQREHPGGAEVVQIIEHRRASGGGFQQIAEAAEEVGPDDVPIRRAARVKPGWSVTNAMASWSGVKRRTSSAESFASAAASLIRPG